MKFDQLDNQPCLLPPVNTTTCRSSSIPVQDGRLEIRPEIAVTNVLCNVQYRTYLIANGVEMEVTSGLTYRSSNVGIALIGAIGGDATGIAEGITTIGVEWQGLEAFAQLQIVESCVDVSNGLMIVLDRSKSMSQSFGGAYGAKLDFAKLLARQFAGEVNVSKDMVGLTTFAVSAEVAVPLTSDSVSVSDAIMNVGFVAQQTDIHAGLETAIEALVDAEVDRRVILLITDGQHNDDVEPLDIAEQFRSQGGIIIAIGLRDGLAAFQRLESIATGGFFVSAYDELTAENAKTYVSDLKGYLCAGSCCPPEGFSGRGRLNYTGWSNWSVDGVVDLIGNGFYDFLPGNGQYVDLIGSSAPWRGALTSKIAFEFINGHDYRLTYKLAGNQRINLPGYAVRVTAGALSSVLRTMDDWRQDFTLYTDEFTGDGSTGQLSFAQESSPLVIQARAYGNMLNDVQLEDLTDDAIIFRDDFDNENVLYTAANCYGIYEGCGAGGGYGLGFGCMTEPVIGQAPDPNSPADSETTSDPPTADPFWVSTQSYTATCPEGKTGPSVTRSATYKSFISMADAINHASALAAAEADLVCVEEPAIDDIINVYFGEKAKTGMAAIGKTASDYWNPWGPGYLKNSEGKLTTVGIAKGMGVANYPDAGYNPGYFHFVSLDHADPMYSSGRKFVDGDGDAKAQAFFFDGLPLGSYLVYIYGHGPDDASQVGQYDLRAGRMIGWPPDWDDDTSFQTSNYRTSAIAPPTADNYLASAWKEGVQYVKCGIGVGHGPYNNIVQTGILVIVIPSHDNEYFYHSTDGLNMSVIMGIQIRRITPT